MASLTRWSKASEPLYIPLQTLNKDSVQHDTMRRSKTRTLSSHHSLIAKARRITSMAIIIGWVLGLSLLHIKFHKLIIPALCVGAAHFGLFAYLNGKRLKADTSIPQAWVASLSLVLANAFRLCICFSLGVAFAQYLWCMIRSSDMRICDFERLHFIRSDPRALLHADTMRVAPILFAFAIMGWAVTIASIFPPGALTVTGANFTSVKDEIVPLFNGSFVGNGTWNSANEYMLGGMILWTYAYEQS